MSDTVHIRNCDSYNIPRCVEASVTTRQYCLYSASNDQMPDAELLQRSSVKLAVALLLTFVAGLVDIIGYLTVYHLFTAHMTGTTVHLGHDLAAGAWTAAGLAGSVVAGFVVGSVAGRALIEAAARLGLRRVASVTIALEAGLVFAFILSLKATSALVASPGIMCLLLVLLACAMGLQTATLTRIGPLTVHTTFVTGMLNKLSQLLSHILFRTYDLARSQPQVSNHLRVLRRENLHEALFFLSIWVVYLAGAVIGTWLQRRWGGDCLYVAIILLSATITIDWIKPLSLQEEQDQSEL